MQQPEQETPPSVRELSKPQRRVLGVLLEKAFTTPEYYPLTLKAVTTGCNQKSNRDPVTQYSEDQVEETLKQLQQMGLTGIVHTESGRSARYRHYMRKRYTFSEQQLAILTELLLRGRQQMGELRSRSSRMVAIETLEELRNELAGLQAESYVQASGSLGSRGVQVDHCFYREGESEPFDTSADAFDDDEPISRPVSAPAHVSAKREVDLQELREENAAIKEELANLRETVEALQEQVTHLLAELGEG